ncbi:hypothetical protein GXW82_34665 [Streptacidiphilus sp. 4-A2]|nr:hypothetical protein [Streptacidiphilus sp. 4-A2]
MTLFTAKGRARAPVRAPQPQALREHRGRQQAERAKWEAEDAEDAERVARGQESRPGLGSSPTWHTHVSPGQKH